MMYLFSWSLRFVSLAGERKLTTSNHILYVFCLSHDFFFPYPPTLGPGLHIWACFLTDAEFLPWRLLLLPVVWLFWGRHVHLSILFRWCWWQTRELMPPKLRAFVTERCLPPPHPIMRKLTKVPPWSSLPCLQATLAESTVLQGLFAVYITLPMVSPVC